MSPIHGQSLQIERKSLDPGLYFLATPIGTARDITLRALDILASAEVLVAEDTRTLRHLMQIHGVALGDRQVLSYHDHNGARMRPKILQLLQDGKSVAYASDAGSPMVADPGFQLARAAMAEGLAVTGAPGPSSVIAALTLSGIPSDRFLFAGFPPSPKGARKRWWEELLAIPATLVTFESAKRLHPTLDLLVELGAGAREIAICRELTKKFEEVRRGPLLNLRAELTDHVVKGEIVLVLDRDRSEVSDDRIKEALLAKSSVLSVRDAATEVAAELGMPRRRAYQIALGLEREKDQK
jgi:16S rRNA (cytidine1402-2'-O)-methyltransferase